jgi:hypothetical protein
MACVVDYETDELAVTGYVTCQNWVNFHQNLGQNLKVQHRLALVDDETMANRVLFRFESYLES